MSPPFSHPRRRATTPSVLWSLVAVPLLAAACAVPESSEGRPSSAVAESPTAPPHIIVLMVDDLGARDTSPALWPEESDGAARHHLTPHLERLAAAGVVFDEAYASAPVCTPTRTSFLTGRSPARSGITYWTKDKDRDTSARHPLLAAPPWNMNGLQPGDVTLPALLASVGYRTIHVGKAHFGTGEGGDPQQLGFDVNVAGWAAGGPGSYLGVDDFSAEGRQRRRGKAGGGRAWDVPGLEEHHGDDVFLTDVLAEAAVRELRAGVEAGERVFLHLAPYAVHAPLMVNERVAGRFAGEDLVRAELAYATLVASVDDALGRVLDTLDELGIADETLVVYTSDNGGLSAHSRGGAKHTHNVPFRSGKGSAYEGGVRVPFVARWPGVLPEGRRMQDVVVTHDLFPTLLRVAGAQIPESHRKSVDGTDLRDAWGEVWRGSAVRAIRPIVWHQPHYWGVPGPGIEPFSAARMGDYKLIYFHSGAELDAESGARSGGPRVELYDVKRDPGETRDLAGERPELLAEMAEQLSRALERRGASMSLALPDRTPVPLPRALVGAR